MKYVKLLTAAYVSTRLRHPHEGSIPVEDAEAKKLVDDGVAEDVTDGFSAAQLKASEPESISAASGAVNTPDPANPHQAEVAPAPATKPRSRGEKE